MHPCWINVLVYFETFEQLSKSHVKNDAIALDNIIIYLTFILSEIFHIIHSFNQCLKKKKKSVALVELLICCLTVTVKMQKLVLLSAFPCKCTWFDIL